MKLKVLNTVFGLAVALVSAASLSYAGSFGWHKSSEKSTNVSFDSATKLPNGSVLAAGRYMMTVPENSQSPEVAFYKYGKEVAQAPAKVVAETQKNPYTEVESTTEGKNQLVTEIRPEGWREKLVFGNSSDHTARSGR